MIWNERFLPMSDEIPKFSLSHQRNFLPGGIKILVKGETKIKLLRSVFYYI